MNVIEGRVDGPPLDPLAPPHPNNDHGQLLTSHYAYNGDVTGHSSDEEASPVETNDNIYDAPDNRSSLDASGPSSVPWEPANYPSGAMVNRRDNQPSSLVSSDFAPSHTNATFIKRETNASPAVPLRLFDTNHQSYGTPYPTNSYREPGVPTNQPSYASLEGGIENADGLQEFTAVQRGNLMWLDDRPIGLNDAYERNRGNNDSHRPLPSVDPPPHEDEVICESNSREPYEQSYPYRSSLVPTIQHNNPKPFNPLDKTLSTASTQAFSSPNGIKSEPSGHQTHDGPELNCFVKGLTNPFHSADLSAKVSAMAKSVHASSDHRAISPLTSGYDRALGYHHALRSHMNLHQPPLLNTPPSSIPSSHHALNHNLLGQGGPLCPSTGGCLTQSSTPLNHLNLAHPSAIGLVAAAAAASIGALTGGPVRSPLSMDSKTVARVIAREREKKRRNNLSEEKKAQIREENRIRQKQYRDNMSPQERQALREKQKIAERNRLNRL